jgi:hypothetical protein
MPGSAAPAHAAIARLSMLAAGSAGPSADVVSQWQEQVDVFFVNGDKYMAGSGAISTIRTIAATMQSVECQPQRN